MEEFDKIYKQALADAWPVERLSAALYAKADEIITAIPITSSAASTRSDAEDAAFIERIVDLITQFRSATYAAKLKALATLKQLRSGQHLQPNGVIHHQQPAAALVQQQLPASGGAGIEPGYQPISSGIVKSPEILPHYPPPSPTKPTAKSTGVAAATTTQTSQIKVPEPASDKAPAGTCHSRNFLTLIIVVTSNITLKYHRPCLSTNRTFFQRKGSSCTFATKEIGARRQTSAACSCCTQSHVRRTSC